MTANWSLSDSAETPSTVAASWCLPVNFHTVFPPILSNFFMSLPMHSASKPASSIWSACNNLFLRQNLAVISGVMKSGSRAVIVMLRWGQGGSEGLWLWNKTIWKNSQNQGRHQFTFQKFIRRSAAVWRQTPHSDVHRHHAAVDWWDTEADSLDAS